MTDAVFFDFYGTLAHFGDYHVEATAEFLDVIGLDDDPREFFEHWNEHFYALKEELVEGDEFIPIWHMYGESLDRTFEDQGRDVSSGEVSEAVSICMERLPEHLQPAPGLHETLKALDHRRLAVVSNADEDDLQSQLRQIEARPFFDVVVSSQAAEAYKPHPRIFRLALDKLDLEPEQVAFVGDSLAWDIKGASELGMTTIWYNGRHQDQVDGVTPDHEIDELTEIPDIVG